ncbi:MAG: hypothetical protein WBG92_16385, partial [Thiohalocapsa sp.]
MSWAGRWSGILGFSISALVHFGIGFAGIWAVEQGIQMPDQEYLVPIDLAMFEIGTNDESPTG